MQKPVSSGLNQPVFIHVEQEKEHLQRELSRVTFPDTGGIEMQLRESA